LFSNPILISYFLFVGFDLYSAEEIVVIPANKNGIVKTDLAVHLPMGSYGRVAPRYYYIFCFII